MSKEEKGQFRTRGFLLYDLIHIASAAVVLTFLFINDLSKTISDPSIQAEFVRDLVSESSSIILGLLLMFFVIFIYHNVDEKLERMAYNFAYVIASLALLIPAIPNIFDILKYASEGKEHTFLSILSALQVLLPLLAFLVFTLSYIKISSKPKTWARTIIFGIFLMICSSVLDLTEIVILLVEGEPFEIKLIIEIAALAAPFLPAIYGIKDLKILIKEEKAKKLSM